MPKPAKKFPLHLNYEFFLAISQYKSKVESYGFFTDYAEMYDQLGKAVLVCRHRLPWSELRNLLGITLHVELMALPYKVRCVELERLTKLYVEDKKARRLRRAKAKDKRSQITPK